MAIPNILNATIIYGRTAYSNVTNSLGNVLVNAASSGNSFRIVNATAANTDTGNIANVNLAVNRSGTTNYLAVGINVPARSSIVLLSKDNSLILEEGDTLQMSADANNRIWGTVVYEEIR
jgi:phosphoheptose isomerase